MNQTDMLSPVKDRDGDLMVAVQMLTYNHEKYIRKAVESVINQKTDFLFRIILGEDCSTDNTREICIALRDKYPDKIELVLNDSNLGVARNAKLHHRLAFESNARYIAVCEGDDYWTDEFKLQKQVEFLERNPDHNICWTRYSIETENGIQELDWSASDFRRTYTPISIQNIFDISRTYPLTVLWRRLAVPFSQLSEFAHSKDITFYCLALGTGKGALLNFSGANYRLHDGGHYSASSEFTQNFQNFLSLHELLSKITNSDRSVIHSKMMFSLDRAAFAACNQVMTKEAYQQVWQSYNALLQVAPIMRKISGLRELLKQTFRRLNKKLSMQ
jgi:glycosyltransferase involved in cell wall biosynthesis